MKIRKDHAIVTERLVLKAFSPEDRDKLTELLRNEKLTETFMVPSYPSEDRYRELADLLIRYSQPEEEKHLEYGIFLGNELIGFLNDCGFDDESIEIGYALHPDHQGHGYATEAVKAVLGELWRMGFRKVIAGFFEENAASFRVMEKCGMKRIPKEEEIVYRGVKHRCLYCEILRAGSVSEERT